MAILLTSAAVLAPLTSWAAEPWSNVPDADSGQKPCELDRTISVQMKYLRYLPNYNSGIVLRFVQESRHLPLQYG
jgi:hypothetical protein